MEDDKKKKVEDEKKKKVENNKKREKKVYDLPGQKRDTPEEVVFCLPSGL